MPVWPHLQHGNHKTGKSADEEETVPGILHPGSTGVIYTSNRAAANGFTESDPEWANMGMSISMWRDDAASATVVLMSTHLLFATGQGAPEVGPIPGAPSRPTSISIADPAVNEYAGTCYHPGASPRVYRRLTSPILSLPLSDDRHQAPPRGHRAPVQYPPSGGQGVKVYVREREPAWSSASDLSRRPANTVSPPCSSHRCASSLVVGPACLVSPPSSGMSLQATSSPSTPPIPTASRRSRGWSPSRPSSRQRYVDALHVLSTSS